MSGGPSNSKSSNEKTQKITTTTTTTMRDVGLTGAQAVDLAAVLESGAVQRAELNTTVLNGLVQATGNAWNQLIGGANELVETSRKASENIINVAPVVSDRILGAASDAASAMIQSPAMLKEGGATITAIMPYVALSVFGVGLLIILMRRGK
jgi:hypothetical protein